ncbi:MAG: ABC transporter ATP-binding protein/permease [Eubacteriaceae bacterium]|jgi:ATP-binding cassette subfamily B protein|nr:ABC transporter ATP-binding protein/permease [Eubacteriaceae bacterium]
MKEEQKFSLARFFARIMRGKARWLALSLAFSFAAVGANMLMPQALRLAIDSAIGGMEPEFPLLGGFAEAWLKSLDSAGLLWAAAALSILFALANAAFGVASRAFLAIGTEGAIKKYRDRLYSHIQRLPYSWHSENQTGDIIQRATSDMNTVRGFIGAQAIEVARTVFMIIAALFLMFTMNVALSLAACAFVPMIVASNVFFYRLVGSRFLKADEAEGELTVLAQESLTGIRVVRAFGMEAFEKERFDSQNEGFTQLWVKLGTVLGYFWAVNDLAAGLQLFTIIAAGSFLAARGSLTAGEFLVFVNYYYQLQWPVRALGRTLSEMSKATVSAKRLEEIEFSAEEDEALLGVEVPMPAEVEFSHVSFGYQGRSVIKDVCFSIPPGSSLGILGPTGSGKSTLASLLCRLFDPDEGEIRIAGTNIKEMPLPYLRRKVGLVLQETFLYSRTIGENISIANPGASQEDIKRAAEAAGLGDTIASFRQGYETAVGERGVTLSGGQKQRLGIARMLLRGAEVFVFDDSLSSVDVVTDLEIRKSLKEALIGKASITISHRAASLMDCDQILVLEDGEVAALGTHAELMEEGGLYRKIFDRQSLGGRNGK